MNISKAITQGWEECVEGEWLNPEIDRLYRSGYTDHRNHIKEHYPKALERVIESFEEILLELERTANTVGGDAEAVRQVILEEIKDLNQAKETLQELNQK